MCLHHKDLQFSLIYDNDGTSYLSIYLSWASFPSSLTTAVALGPFNRGLWMIFWSHEADEKCPPRENWPTPWQPFMCCRGQVLKKKKNHLLKSEMSVYFINTKTAEAIPRVLWALRNVVLKKATDC